MIKSIKCIFIATSLLVSNSYALAPDNEKMDFWSEQKKGANVFNFSIDKNVYDGAKKYGISFFRLAPDKFLTKNKDFLIGNADNFTNIDLNDLNNLKKVLDECQNNNIKVVITMLSLPGSRWSQLNKNKDDLRIWKEDKYLKQAENFWEQLAKELKNRPEIVGYNILNEPHPEKFFKKVGIKEKNEIKTMLHKFNEGIIAAIRKQDTQTPVIIDSTDYANPQTFSYLIPVSDKNVIYSFHMYEPYNYTNLKKNNGKYSYPGKTPDFVSKKNIYWDKKALENYISSVNKFQKEYSIPSNKIIAGEFGGNRFSKGLDLYFSDLISIFNKNNWHWAVYSFREDQWDGMDYELGDKKLPYQFWDANKKDQNEILTNARNSNYSNSKTFIVLKSEWEKQAQK